MKTVVQNKRLCFGDGKITVQSMTNLAVTDVEGTCQQIRQLASCGCDIVRIALPNAASVSAFKQVRNAFANLPLVADIHFDYRLAIAAMEAGADKVRINPGNMSQDCLDKVIDAAKANDVILRLGVNGGSVSKAHLQSCKDKCHAMVASLQQYVQHCQQRNFNKLVLSLKSSDVQETVQLNRLAAQMGYPLHLGVTEAGPYLQGVVKNSIGIGSLLLEGIGDTIRVSLTAHPTKEVEAGKQILRSLGLIGGVTFVSCPQCGRCSINLQQVAEEIYNFVKDMPINAKIAVMGCEVNGPGECSDADLGIAGANGKFVFFKQGKKFCTVPQQEGVQLFKQEVLALAQQRKG